MLTQRPQDHAVLRCAVQSWLVAHKAVHLRHFWQYGYSLTFQNTAQEPLQLLKKAWTVQDMSGASQNATTGFAVVHACMCACVPQRQGSSFQRVSLHDRHVQRCVKPRKKEQHSCTCLQASMHVLCWPSSSSCRLQQAQGERWHLWPAAHH